MIMQTRRQTFTLTALAAARAALHGQALAAAADEDLARLTDPSSSVSIGAGYLGGDDRRQLGIIGGLRDTGGYLLLDADVNMRNDDTGTWTNLWISNLGMTSREVRGEYQKQGDYGAALEYRQSKREVPYEVNTGLIGFGTATQTVPAVIAPGTGVTYQLGTERKKTGLEFFKYLIPGLKFKVNFTNEDKDGDRHGRVGGQPEFAAVPIDWNVKQLDTTLSYVTDRLQVLGGYNGSWYKNANDLLTVNRAVQATTFYYISQPLDSEAHQLFVDAGYNFTPTTRGTVKISYTRATQDEYIPTADIAGLAWQGDANFPAAPTHLDGEINTTLIQLGLTARPMPRLSVVANLRYHDVDDDTPEHLIINTIGNAASGFARTLVDGTPLSYETLTGKLEATYSLPEGYSLIAGIDYSTQDRTVPFGSDVAGGPPTPDNGDAQPDGHDDQRYVPWRSELDEITYRLQLRKSMSDTVNGALAFLHSKRDGSAYSEAIHSEPGEGIHPEAIDPINISDRDRNKVRATLDWAAAHHLNLQFNGEYARDDYSGHTLGLRDGKAWLFSVDANYEISKDWQVTSWFSHDVTEAKQHNYRFASGTYSEAEMFDTLTDTGDSVGLGMKGLVNPKLRIGADAQWTRTRSEYDQTLVPLGAGTLYETARWGRWRTSRTPSPA
jgi:MtrB/PioB family decaheme-associated outer membrane protein